MPKKYSPTKKKHIINFGGLKSMKEAPRSGYLADLKSNFHAKFS